MDESALKILLDNLEVCRSSLDSWLFFWTSLVVVGVALEIAFVILEYLDALHEFRRGIVRPPGKPKTALLMLGLFGSALVTVGVTGELWVGVKIGSVETKIRKANGDLTTLLSKEAGDAKVSAEGAASAADRANTSADSAIGKANRAQRTVEEVDKHAGRLDWTLDMAQYLLSTTRVRDPDGLKSQISQFKGKTIVFRSYFNDSDGYFLCEEILSVAESAGVIPTDQCGLWMAKPLFPLSTGIVVSAPNDNTMLVLSKIMASVTPYGASTGVFGPYPHSPTVTIFVGRKPAAHVGETTQTRDAGKRAAVRKRARRGPPKP